jgi:hypothetical protein
VKREEAWPRVVGRMTGRSVYNLGLGGYGPNQYYELFTTRALRLAPRVVVCGLYMGDDFANAFQVTYRLDRWAYLRGEAGASVDPGLEEPRLRPSWHKNLRVWMSRHSVVYQLAFHGPLLGRVLGALQIEHASRLDDAAVSLRVPERAIREAFLPRGPLRGLDQASGEVREGMRITFRLLKEMNETCRRRDIRFLVAVIPTKPMVHSEYLEGNPRVPLGDVLDALLANERAARAKLFRFLDDARIPYVDVLPALKGSIARGPYARSATDMHPSKVGHRAIGEAVAAALAVTQEAK